MVRKFIRLFDLFELIWLNYLRTSRRQNSDCVGSGRGGCSSNLWSIRLYNWFNRRGMHVLRWDKSWSLGRAWQNHIWLYFTSATIGIWKELVWHILLKHDMYLLMVFSCLFYRRVRINYRPRPGVKQQRRWITIPSSAGLNRDQVSILTGPTIKVHTFYPSLFFQLFLIY